MALFWFFRLICLVWLSVMLKQKGCGLSDDSCSTNGVFLNESCECLCKKGFAGVNCEVIGDNNVCTEAPDLCGVGQYCEADTKATNGKKYVCKCNPLEGYYGENKCAEGKAFTTVLHVNKINDEDAGYKYAYRDIYSAESKKIFEVLISVINGSLGKDATTRNVKEIIGIRLEEGSVRVTVVVIFPKDANINVDNIVPVLKQKILSYGSTTLQLDPNQFSVTESSPETCSEDFCNDNRGICKLIGFFPDKKPLCSCKEGFTGTQCDIVEGCELTDGSCENGGTFVKESCECLCRKNFAGFRCEVSTEKNPCTENPDLCPERGQYCESDTKITDGKEYVCKCNSLEGYVEKDGKCIEEEPFTTKLDVTRIDGIDATYKPAHRDINSAESRKVLDAVIPVIKISLKENTATETVIDVVGIRLENGSIGVTTIVIFPKGENVKDEDLTYVLKRDKLGNASMGIELNREKINVSKPQSAGCSPKYCSNDGTCRLGGVFPDLRPSCSCARDFYGPTCDSVVLTPFIIAMITFGTVAFLILAGVLVFCLFVRARGGRHKAGEKVSRADRLYASAWKTGPDILSHYLTEELDDKEADSETDLSSVSDERMEQLVKDLKGSSFQMKRAKSVYQWESVKFNKPPSQPRYADNPSMLELKNSRDRRWYTSSNI